MLYISWCMNMVMIQNHCIYQSTVVSSSLYYGTTVLQPFSVFNCLCASRPTLSPTGPCFDNCSLMKKLPFTPHLLWIELRFLASPPSVTIFLSDEVQLQKGKVSYRVKSACVCVYISARGNKGV